MVQNTLKRKISPCTEMVQKGNTRSCKRKMQCGIVKIQVTKNRRRRHWENEKKKGSQNIAEADL